MIHELRDGDCVMFGVDVTMNEEGLAQLDSYLSKNFGPKGDRSVTFIAIPGLNGLHVLRKSIVAEGLSDAAFDNWIEVCDRLIAIQKIHEPGSHAIPAKYQFCPECDVAWPCDTWKLADGGGDDAK